MREILNISDGENLAKLLKIAALTHIYGTGDNAIIIASDKITVEFAQQVMNLDQEAVEALRHIPFDCLLEESKDASLEDIISDQIMLEDDYDCGSASDYDALGDSE